FLSQRCHPAGLILRLTPLSLESADGGVSWDTFLIDCCVQHRADWDQDVLERVPTEACLASKECPDVGPLQLPKRQLTDGRVDMVLECRAVSFGRLEHHRQDAVDAEPGVSKAAPV